MAPYSKKTTLRPNSPVVIAKKQSGSTLWCKGYNYGFPLGLKAVAFLMFFYDSSSAWELMRTDLLTVGCKELQFCYNGSAGARQGNRGIL